MRYNPISDSRKAFLTNYWISRGGLGDETELFKIVSETDPTFTGKYSKWILDLVINKTSVLPDDSSEIREAILIFDKAKALLPVEHRDIHKFPTYSSLRSFLRKTGNILSKQEVIRIASKNGQVLLGSNSTPNYIGALSLWKITTCEAASDLASGTAWCVKDPKWCIKYLKKGPLLFIFKTVQYHKYDCKKCGFSSELSNKVYEICKSCSRPVNSVDVLTEIPFVLVHIESDEIKDVDNKDLSEDELEKITPLLLKFIPTFLITYSIKSIMKRETPRTYRKSESGWAGGEHEVKVIIAEDSSAEGYTTKVWHKRRAWSGTNSTHVIYVKKDWVEKVLEAKIASYDHNLVIDVTPLEKSPPIEWLREYTEINSYQYSGAPLLESILVKVVVPSRGVSLKTEEFVLIRTLGIEWSKAIKLSNAKYKIGLAASSKLEKAYKIKRISKFRMNPETEDNEEFVPKKGWSERYRFSKLDRLGPSSNTFNKPPEELSRRISEFDYVDSEEEEEEEEECDWSKPIETETDLIVKFCKVVRRNKYDYFNDLKLIDKILFIITNIPHKPVDVDTVIKLVGFNLRPDPEFRLKFKFMFNRLKELDLI